MARATKGKKRPAKVEPYPATGSPSDAPHVSRAVEGCACLACRMHRRLDRQARIDVKLATRHDPYARIGAVKVGSSATDELRGAIGAKDRR